MSFYMFAVLGDPIAHSRSPELHRAMLEISGLEGEYTRVRADEQILEAELARMRQGAWHGLNITMPLKAAAARLADSTSPQARRAGSVNTLVPADGAIHGESTDATAIHELLDSGRFDDRTAILVLGSGGAAAAVLSAIDDREPVYVAARRPERAEELTQRLGGANIAWGTAVAGALVVNTTPLGMHGEALPGDVLDAASGLIDLPYRDGETPAIVTARRRDMEAADGHEFLLRQAIASFRLWTGAEVTYPALVHSLRKG
jgi:shikimate dehydrogenase